MTETKTKEQAAPKAEKTVTEPKAKKATSKANKEEIMEKYLQMIQFVQNTVGNIENDLKRVSIVLSQLSKFDPENPEQFLEVEKDAKEIF